MNITNFKDKNGNEWHLDINISHYLEFKSKHNIDLSDAFSQEDNWIATIAAHENLDTLLQMLETLVRGQISEKGMTLDNFYEGINGEVISDATSAFLEAVVLFLPAHKQKAMRIILDSVKVGMEKTVEKIEASEAEIQSQMKLEMDKMLNEKM